MKIQTGQLHHLVKLKARETLIVMPETNPIFFYQVYVDENDDIIVIKRQNYAKFKSDII